MSRSLILGSHAYFVRDGLTVDEITVGRESKPDNDPIANWTDVGIVGDFGVNGTSNEIVIKRPMPGQMVDYDTIRSNNQMVFNTVIREGSPLMWELLFGSGVIDPDAMSNPGAFVPNIKTADVKGWWKFQQYDQNNALISVVDVYCASRINDQWTAAMAHTDPITFSIDHRVLYSTLNSGVLSNLT